MREGYDIANTPLLFLKLGQGRCFRHFVPLFQLLITINQYIYYYELHHAYPIRTTNHRKTILLRSCHLSYLSIHQR
jgi:hypothetical protein